MSVNELVTSKVRFPPAPLSDSLDENDYIYRKSRAFIVKFISNNSQMFDLCLTSGFLNF